MVDPAAGDVPPFVVAVLTGGASRRMGRDKATLPVDGVAMAARVCDAARRAGAAATACIGLEVPGEAHLADDHPGDGPLGGLLTALRWAGDRPVAVLACDLVAPSPAAIRRAVAHLADGETAQPDPAPPADATGAVPAPLVPAASVPAAAVPVVEGRAQWLHAAWRPAAALGPLMAAFAAGERSIHRAAPGLPLRRYDEPDLEALRDADEPADLPGGPAAPSR